jgi:hypothetical protein
MTIHLKVTFIVTAEIALDEKVISVVDDEWRGTFYNLHDIEDIAEHIAYNMVKNEVRLSQIDGWADQPDENAKLLGEEWHLDEVEEL